MEHNNSFLRKFVIAEMKSREMSERKFAEFIGVSSTTINRVVDETKNHVPSVELLVKLADKTGMDIVSIIGLAFPEVAARTRVNPSTIILAQRIERLPETAQNFILRAVGITGDE